jgi:hypothetical protein
MRNALMMALALLPAAGWAQPQPHKMEILLERLDAGSWKTVDPGLVFAQNDRVRFRFHANFDGYLYVMNRSTSGKYEQLFPRDETGQENRIRAGTDYMVPATQTVFRIGGPAGHEIIYWMVSPVRLTDGAGRNRPLPPPDGKPPANMTPRCDNEIFRARGECVDSSAGPQGVARDETVPQNLAGAARPRDLLFMRKEKSTVVSSMAPLTGPVIYEFRLAQK